MVITIDGISYEFEDYQRLIDLLDQEADAIRNTGMPDGVSDDFLN